MTSQIDPTKPGEGAAFTEDVRQNFAIAADEISALQTGRMGVTDGSEALPGQVGEYQVQSNTTGVELPQLTPLTVCPISLSPGDWEIWGSVDFTPPGNVSPNMITAAISVTPDALPTQDDLMTGVGILCMFTTNALTSGQRQVLMTGTCRSNSAAPLDLYLVAQSDFGGSTNRINAKGYVCARRVR